MPEILSQEEINALLSALTGESVGDGAAPEPVPIESRAIKPYDFRRPDKFSKIQLRTLQFMHETFARHASTALSAFLRAPIKLSLTLVEQLTFDQFISSLPVPTVVGIIDMAPLDGKAVLEINPAVVFPMVDRLLGGRGKVDNVSEKARDLSDVESVLVRRIIARLLEAFANTWQSIAPFEVKLDVLESNPQFVQVMSPGDTVVAIAFDISFGDATGTMSLCLSYITLQPILPKLSAQQWFTERRKTLSDQKRDILKRKLDSVRLPVSAQIGYATLTVDEILNLQPGDVIMLDHKASDDIEIHVASRARFCGKPGAIGKRLAVKITGIIGEEGGCM